MDSPIPIPRYEFRSSHLLALAGLVIVALTAFTSIFTVPTESVGVVLRFGAIHSQVPPGLHFKLPFGIDRAFTVPVERQLKQEFGFGTIGATNVSQFPASREEEEREKSMVTGDLNSVLVEWVVQYRILDPTYALRVRNPEFTLRDISESVMREVVGDRTVDEVITIGRREVEGEVLRKLQAVADRCELGLSISQVQVMNVNPPREVQASFNEVNQAQQEKERSINVANGDYNKEVPRARGEADQVIEKARGYAARRINEAQGDAGRFAALFEEYRKAPEVTRRRLYLETFGEILPQLGRKIIIDSDASQVLPLLQLRETDAP